MFGTARQKLGDIEFANVWSVLQSSRSLHRDIRLLSARSGPNLSSYNDIRWVCSKLTTLGDDGGQNGLQQDRELGSDYSNRWSDHRRSRGRHRTATSESTRRGGNHSAVLMAGSTCILLVLAAGLLIYVAGLFRLRRD